MIAVLLGKEVTLVLIDAVVVKLITWGYWRLTMVHSVSKMARACQAVIGCREMFAEIAKCGSCSRERTTLMLHPFERSFGAFVLLSQMLVT